MTITTAWSELLLGHKLRVGVIGKLANPLAVTTLLGDDGGAFLLVGNRTLCKGVDYGFETIETLLKFLVLCRKPFIYVFHDRASSLGELFFEQFGHFRVIHMFSV
jgi:hypothetical protein